MTSDSSPSLQLCALPIDQYQKWPFGTKEPGSYFYRSISGELYHAVCPRCFEVESVVSVICVASEGRLPKHGVCNRCRFEVNIARRMGERAKSASRRLWTVL